MRQFNHRLAARLSAWLMALVILAVPYAAVAQTQIRLHSNRYSTADDVKVGQQVAAEVEQQMPVLRDSQSTAYVEEVGRRLVNAIPSQFQHPEFRYYFRIVNASDINAFALPGGPMYLNRGMIEAARTEGEMAGVMAHELAHVALRHGTAQATKAQKYSILAGVAGIAGAILGGPAVGQIGQAAVGAYFLKFSREYETEADILGAQIMARAGYDPRDLANMFRTIQSQGGSSGPEFLSSHPNPANRYERINQEAAMLRVQQPPIQNDMEFRQIQARLRGNGRAPTMAEIARSGQRYPTSGGGNYPEGGRVSNRVEYPSSSYRTYTQGNLFRVSVPSNWRELSAGSNSIWYAPDGAYGDVQNTSVFTHGVNLGVTRTSSRYLQQATDEFIRSMMQGSDMRQQSGYQRGTIDGRNALAITLTNVNEATGRQEIVTVYTTMLQSGDLFYVISVAPRDEYNNYQRTFQNVLGSIRLNG
ncbi:MAG TPA: M48 family metallopeptidase [Pyrinomonadaceae bacterium]|nr:M48 family metallopeptidase [Pyrinomonadaceae bacterium]